MLIKYKLLWVDDNIQDINGADVIKEIGEYIEELGFVPNISTREEANYSREEFQQNNYDLIISDYNLPHDGVSENQMHGDSLINKIREDEIFTEILFYSSQRNFEEIANNLYQDRISFFSLVDDSEYKKLKNKIKKLINLTVKKLQEIDNLRGMIIGATCELDALITDKLRVLAEDKHLNQKAIELLSKKHNYRVRKYNQIECSLRKEHYLENTLFSDACLKARILNHYLKTPDLMETFKGDSENFLENYKNKILTIRNKFAHARKINDGTLKTQNGEESFDMDECIKIRKNINKLYELIENLNVKTNQ